jgi:ribose-phosphate pyrophosphokinase
MQAKTHQTRVRPVNFRSESNDPDSHMIVFSGTAHPQLANAICARLNLPLGKANVARFSDGEVQIEISENVRGKDVFIVQPTGNPADNHLMELLLMVDAIRRSSAYRITAVIPYFGYSRQDRRPRSARVPISARVVANMITVVGTDRVVTIDLHSDQIQGFFDIPVDNVYSSPVLLSDIWRTKYPKLIVVSPDVGGVVRARAMAKLLGGADLAIVDKRRPGPNIAKVMNIIGDVRGRTCVLLDDIVDTAGTLCEAARVLKEEGASRVVAYCTHAVLSGAAVRRLNESVIDELIVTDTIPLRPEAQDCPKVRQLSVADLLAETMRRINAEESVSSIYMD